MNVSFSQVWTWRDGEKLTNQSGVYGIKHNPNPMNIPGGRDKSVSWTDQNGDRWLFGGEGVDATGASGRLNDMWLFDTALGQWVWVHGDSTHTKVGVYGSIGASNATNVPGSRIHGAACTSNDNKLWLFGGEGWSQSSQGLLNDLWMFDPVTKEWTWMHGGNVANQIGDYGTINVSAPTNVPGARSEAMLWFNQTDNHIYLFGGNGYNNTNTTGLLNDTWKFSLASREWTYVAGTDLLNEFGRYNIPQAQNPTNIPGSRKGAATFIDDSTGDLWMFGGHGFDGVNQELLNDLWKFNEGEGWIWMDGDTVRNKAGIYGQVMVPDPANNPGSRMGAHTWSESGGSLWLFGGYGRDNAAGLADVLGDLWHYDIIQKEWVWINGSKTKATNANYGTINVPNPSNIPGARRDGVSWFDPSTRELVLFGGRGWIDLAAFGTLHDVWTMKICLDLRTDILITDASCKGDANGILNVTGIGGSGTGYMFSLDDVTYQTETQFDSLASGSYTVYIEDDELCKTDTTVIITEPSQLILSDSIHTESICDGNNNTRAELFAVGGTTPYLFSTDTVNFTPNKVFTNVPDGTYLVAVKDANNCFDTLRVNINTPAQLSVSVVPSNSSCGVSDGSAVATPVGGSGPFTYQWTNGSQTNTANNLSAGIYLVNVTDAAGCHTFEPVKISDNNGPVVSISSSTNVSCHGGSDGQATVNYSGGTGPYKVLWSNGETTDNISNLESGVYEVTVEDGIGCIGATGVFISQPSSLDVNFALTEADCGGVANGAILANPSGGTPPYNYLWSNLDATANPTGLVAGVYGIQITDVNGCVLQKVVTVNEKTAPTIHLMNISSSDCGSDNAFIDIECTGGPTGVYSYLWGSGGTNEDAMSTGSGVKQVTVTDAGCTASRAFMVEGTAPNITPTCILVTVDSTTGNNFIVWGKELTTNIVEYKLYREGYMRGRFHLIATIPYGSQSDFEDTVSNSSIRSWRYRLSAIDICGVESIISESNKTIHLALTDDGNGNPMLVWDEYNGLNFPEYNIYRRTTANSWEMIATQPANVNSYIDMTAPAIDPLLEYFIQIDPDNGGCTASKAKDYNTARSNRRNKNKGTSNDIRVKEIEVDFDVFPNPNNGNFIITGITSENASLKIYNIQGKTVYNQVVFGSGSFRKDIQLTNLESGMYFVEFNSPTDKQTEKLIIK